MTVNEFAVGDRVQSVTTGAQGKISALNGDPHAVWVTWVHGGERLVNKTNLVQLSGTPEQGVNPKDIIGATKPDLSLVPPVAEIYLATAMMNGASKYGAYNWREHPVQVMTYLAAAKRHLDSYLDGEEVAEDSGVHHLAHAMACFAIVLDAQETGNLVDNRPKPGVAARLIARLTKGGK